MTMKYLCTLTYRKHQPESPPVVLTAALTPEMFARIHNTAADTRRIERDPTKRISRIISNLLWMDLRSPPDMWVSMVWFSTLEQQGNSISLADGEAFLLSRMPGEGRRFETLKEPGILISGTTIQLCAEIGPHGAHFKSRPLCLQELRNAQYQAG